uniref:Uncharacterized protein n=1 Tax=Lactuca sativa TaxID=4236 RepID=A0A9R1XL47_LACSA|nr:hypothetical protein LSAT_V11C300126510 [Lactuca sativa]
MTGSDAGARYLQDARLAVSEVSSAHLVVFELSITIVRSESALTLRALAEIDPTCVGGLVNYGITTLKALRENRQSLRQGDDVATNNLSVDVEAIAFPWNLLLYNRERDLETVNMFNGKVEDSFCKRAARKLLLEFKSDSFSKYEASTSIYFIRKHYFEKSTNHTSFRATVSDGTIIIVLGDAQTRYIVNVVREENEEAVRLPPSISIEISSDCDLVGYLEDAWVKIFEYKKHVKERWKLVKSGHKLAETRLRAMVARDVFRIKRNKATTIVQGLP